MNVILCCSIHEKLGVVLVFSLCAFGTLWPGYVYTLKQSSAFLGKLVINLYLLARFLVLRCTFITDYDTASGASCPHICLFPQNIQRPICNAIARSLVQTMLCVTVFRSR